MLLLEGGPDVHSITRDRVCHPCADSAWAISYSPTPKNNPMITAYVHDGRKCGWENWKPIPRKGKKSKENPLSKSCKGGKQFATVCWLVGVLKRKTMLLEGLARNIRRNSEANTAVGKLACLKSIANSSWILNTCRTWYPFLLGCTLPDFTLGSPPLKINMPTEKDNHLPNLHGWVPC